jgi:hypothetical protein
MYCKSGCSDNKYFISVNIQDNINQDIFTRFYYYESENYKTIRWYKQTERFKYEKDKIKV